MFSLRKCPTCNALRDNTEMGLCCLKGKRLVSSDMFPVWHGDYTLVVERHASVLLSHSREINNDMCFTSIGSDH